MSPARSDGAIRLMSRVIDVLNSRPLRRLSGCALTGLLHLRRVLPRGPLDRLLRWYLAADSPCAGLPDTPSRRFVRWFFQHFGEKTMRRAQAFVNETPAAQAARRLDRFLRLLVVAELRAIARLLRGSLSDARVAAAEPGPASAVSALRPVLPRLLHARRSPGPTAIPRGCGLDDRRGRVLRRLHHPRRRQGRAVSVAELGRGILDVMAARPHLFFTVVTHGMRITPQQAARLGRLGNVLILVSIDGPPSCTMPAAARVATRVQQALSLLRQHGVLRLFDHGHGSEPRRAHPASICR